MIRRLLPLIVYMSMIGPIMSIVIPDQTGITQTPINSSQTTPTNNSEDQQTYSDEQQFKRECPTITPATRTDCAARAENTAQLNDDDDDDLEFFKKCIVDFYCFKKLPNANIWSEIPTFRGIIGTEYFNHAAKRVELFFIRNNDWSRTVINPNFRNVSSGECANLLYVTAARYLYVTYVLDMVSGDLTFAPCDIDSSTRNLIVPDAGVCFPAPHGVVTCTSDFDIALVGKRSGSLTARFNQFFREPLGLDSSVAGFGKTAEEIFDTNVHAFTLEFAMPSIYSGLTQEFVTEAEIINAHIKFRIQEVVSAILKMNTYNSKYFNDLMSDQVELRNRPTKNSLDAIFHDWTVQFQAFSDAVGSLKSSDKYTTIISFKYRQNIAYEMIMGLIDATGIPKTAGNALAETAIALMYASEAYHTRGTARHVVGWTQMNRGDVLNKISVNDYWVSMLENWADSIKEYNRECARHSLQIAACLPKMSKYLWRMLDAMHTIRSKLPTELQQDLAEMDNVQTTGIRSVMLHWLNNVKRKGLVAIPSDDRLPNLLPTQGDNLDVFLTTFSCTSQLKYLPLAESCVDAIQAEIRKYNRRLFLHLVNSDPA